VNESVDFEPDDVVTSLESVAGETPDLVALAGFLGEAHGEGAENRVRLHLDPSLNRWVELERSAIVKRERVPQERGPLAPHTVIWVRGEVLREEFEEVPERLELEFLNDRAELWIEPPRSMLEVVEYMKMSADYFFGGITWQSRKPKNHC
jgi:hypothetical protein